jgi:hypothetical protein
MPDLEPACRSCASHISLEGVIACRKRELPKCPIRCYPCGQPAQRGDIGGKSGTMFWYVKNKCVTAVSVGRWI